MFHIINVAQASGIVDMPSASGMIASSSEVANPVFQGFLPIAYWIIGAMLGVAFIILIIYVGEIVYNAVVHGSRK